MTHETLTSAQIRALDTGKSICVTAGAGTGKTFILSQRYRRLLTDHHAASRFGPANILALTFTEKAAAEMRERIETDLADDISSCRDASLRQNLLRMQDEFCRADISTFHSFAASLLKEFAVDAGLDPGFGIMDEGDKAELLRDILDSLLTRPPQDLKSDIAFLLQYLNSTTLREVLTSARTDWPEAEPWFELLESNPESILERWEDAYRSYWPSARDALIKNPEIQRIIREVEAAGRTAPNLKYCQTLMEFWPKLIQACDPETIKTCLISLNSAQKRGAALKKINAEPLKDGIKTILDIPDITTPPLEEHTAVLGTIGHVLRALEQSFAEEKHKRGVLDFDDLITVAVRLIETNETVQNELKERYRYILVDEVQDNDPHLSSFIRNLAGSPESGNRLFIVGDLKQSIYRFRGADIRKNTELFTAFPESSRVSLDVSFRTVPAIIRFVNLIFTRIFTGAATEYDVSYDSLLPSRTDTDATITLLTQTKITGELSGDCHIRESEMIAAWIYAAVRDRTLTVHPKSGNARPVEYGDIAILLNTRTHLSQLCAALQKFSIPYLVYKSGSLYTRQETRDLGNLLTVLINPKQDAALYGLLRSPWFGVSDADLCRLRTRSRPLWDDVKNSERCTDIAKTIHDWGVLATRLPLSSLLRTILRESGILTTYAAMPEGEMILANIEKLLVVLDRSGTLFQAASRLSANIEAAVKEDEGEVPAGNRVQILTIHASKGLEYPVTILGFAGDKNSVNAANWIFDSSLGPGLSLMVTTPDGSDESTKSFVMTLLTEREQTAEKMEHKRKLYVALTRPRDHLVISGTYTNSGTADANSFLSYLDTDLLRDGGVLEQHADDLPQPDRGAAENLSVPDGWEDTETIFRESAPDAVPFIRPSDAVKTSGRESSLLRGLALHDIFAGISLDRAVEKYGISFQDAETFASMRDEFLASSLCSGCIAEYKELPLWFASRGSWVRGRVDRILVHADRVIVVDFKSGHRDSCGDLMEGYCNEVRTYMDGVSQLFCKKTEGYLYFPEDEEKLFPVFPGENL